MEVVYGGAGERKKQFYFGDSKEANFLNGGAERLTLNVEHDGGFAGSHGVSGAADVFARVLPADAGQLQAAVYLLVPPRQRGPQLGPGDGW